MTTKKTTTKKMSSFDFLRTERGTFAVNSRNEIKIFDDAFANERDATPEEVASIVRYAIADHERQERWLDSIEDLMISAGLTDSWYDQSSFPPKPIRTKPIPIDQFFVSLRRLVASYWPALRKR
jgi:hypothetical protein